MTSFDETTNEADKFVSTAAAAIKAAEEAISSRVSDYAYLRGRRQDREQLVRTMAHLEEALPRVGRVATSRAETAVGEQRPVSRETIEAALFDLGALVDRLAGLAEALHIRAEVLRLSAPSYSSPRFREWQVAATEAVSKAEENLCDPKAEAGCRDATAMLVAQIRDYRQYAVAVKHDLEGTETALEELSDRIRSVTAGRNQAEARATAALSNARVSAVKGFLAGALIGLFSALIGELVYGGGAGLVAWLVTAGGVAAWNRSNSLKTAGYPTIQAELTEYETSLSISSRNVAQARAHRDALLIGLSELLEPVDIYASPRYLAS